MGVGLLGIGTIGLANITTVAPPDREAEEISRAAGPKLGQLLYTNANAKIRRYRTKRRQAIPVGCPGKQIASDWLMSQLVDDVSTSELSLAYQLLHPVVRSDI